MDRELEGIMAKINLLREDEKQQDQRDLKELQEKTERMNSKAKETAKSLRTAANKLDNVWRDCKRAHAVGTSLGIMGGLLSVGGGLAITMAAGPASPLLGAGLSLAGTGATANIGATTVEALINSAEIKKAEEQLGETMNSINEVNRIVQKILMAKETARLIYIYNLAQTLKFGGPLVLKILRELVFFSTGTPTKMVVPVAETVMACVQTVTQASAKAATQGGAQGAGKAAAQSVDDMVRAAGQAGAQASDDVVQAGTRAGSEAVGKALGKVVIVVNVACVVWDVIDLGFTIRDLVENKGSEAAKVLRQKADKLESAMK